MSILNTAPNWCKDAVATATGWTDKVTGELLVAIKLSKEVVAPEVKEVKEVVAPKVKEEKPKPKAKAKK